MFNCHLIYALLAWGSANKTTLNPIIKKQKNAIRIISKAAYNSHTEPLFKKQEILRFEDLYTFTQLEFFHSYVYEKLPTSFQSNWVLNRFQNPTAASLRNANEFFVPFARIQLTGITTSCILYIIALRFYVRIYVCMYV